MNGGSMKRYALTAIGRDRPGIVAAVTKALYEHDCNIEDSSMTILEDEFAIILIMSMPEKSNTDSLLKDIKNVERFCCDKHFESFISQTIQFRRHETNNGIIIKNLSG